MLSTALNRSVKYCTTSLQNLFIFQNWHSAFIKQKCPISLSLCPWQPSRVEKNFLSLWIWILPITLISGIIQYLSFCDWLISHSIMVHPCCIMCQNFLSFKGWIVLCRMAIYHILSIHLLVNGHLCCLHFLAIVNNAAMNMGVKACLWDPAFNYFGYMFKSGIGLFLVFLRNRRIVFHSRKTILHFQQQCTKFFTFLPTMHNVKHTLLKKKNWKRLRFEFEYFKIWILKNSTFGCSNRFELLT